MLSLGQYQLVAGVNLESRITFATPYRHHPVILAMRASMSTFRAWTSHSKYSVLLRKFASTPRNLQIQT
jgi:hypothetical protein